MQAKKSLGQHFLTSPKAVRTMITAGEPFANETVLEIGPGKGVLTKELLAKAKRVVAVEKDAELIPFLSEVFAAEIKEGNFILIQGDVLTLDPSSIPALSSGYTIVANIPYYITGAIIEHFLSTKNHPQNMVLLMQKEVAERIVSRDGKESVLSLAVKAFGVPKLVEKVPKGAFSPSPKVDSAIISITSISHSFFDTIHESDFFTLVKTLFGKKRKQVGGSLGDFLKDKALAQHILEQVSISPQTRPEEIPLPVWKKITQLVAKEK